MNDRVAELAKKSAETDLAVLLHVKEHAKRTMKNNPTKDNVDAFEKARLAVERKMAKDDKTAGRFLNLSQVHEWLQENGWKCSTRTLYKHKREGKLKADKSGVFPLKAVKKYAKDFLKRSESGLRVADEQSDLQREKVSREIKKLEVQTAKERFQLDVLQGKFLPRDDVEAELCGRLIMLETALRNLIRDKGAEWVFMVGGDGMKVQELQRTMHADVDAMFNGLASMREFAVEIVDDDMPPASALTFGDDENEK
ncbi:hypothetical protein [Desulfovibrio inopinatus]|uniref:hypothetical protein n=1 Tax=Desulfovibrio inopinatus TaxID=102109 RepID=UPI0004194EF2|nr:hypothetical protein [Desulfovibrio inopinatus]